jgi:hypothetical protein
MPGPGPYGNKRPSRKRVVKIKQIIRLPKAKHKKIKLYR